MENYDKYENAWHHVRGITSEEMKKAAREAMERYGDLIELAHPVSRKHPPLSRTSRAAQFSPFAALSGFDEMIRRAGEEEQ